MKQILLRTLVMALAIAMITPLSARSKRGAMKRDKLDIVSFDGVQRSTGGVLKVKLSVRNDFGFKLRLLNGTITVEANDKEIANAKLLEEVVVPRKSTTQVVLPVRVNVDNPLRALSIAKQIKKGSIPDVTLSAEATIKAMGQKRTFKDNITAMDLLKQLKDLIFKK